MLSNEHVLDRREVHAGFEARFLSALRSSESKSIVHQIEWHLSYVVLDECTRHDIRCRSVLQGDRGADACRQGRQPFRSILRSVCSKRELSDADRVVRSNELKVRGHDILLTSAR